MLGDLRNIDIMGLHFHIGSQITDLGGSSRRLCRKVNASYRWFTEEGFRITDVNVGGGLGVDYDVPEMHPVPDFAAYFAVFAQGLDLPASVGGTLRDSDARSWHNAANSSPRYSLRR